MDFLAEFIKSFFTHLFKIIFAAIAIFLLLSATVGLFLALLSVIFEWPDRLARKKPAAPKATPARQSRCQCTKSEKG